MGLSVLAVLKYIVIGRVNDFLDTVVSQALELSDLSSSWSVSEPPASITK